MSDHLLIHGDEAEFDQIFGAAKVVVGPGKLIASGLATVKGTKVCVAGDEKSVLVPGCAYTTESYPIPGVGMLQIASLAADQTAQKTRSADKAVLLVGSSFTARFVVQAPAMKPKPPAPPDVDATSQYSGTGKFKTKNTKFTGV